LKIRKIDSLEGLDATPLKTVSSLAGVRSTQQWVCPPGVDSSKDTSQCRPVMIAALGSTKDDERSRRLWDDDRPGDGMGVDYPEDFEWPRRGSRGVGALEDDEDEDERRRAESRWRWVEAERAVVIDEPSTWRAPEEIEGYGIKCRLVTRQGRQRVLCEGTDPVSGTTLRGLIRERQKARAKARATQRKRRRSR
jgi:hypothetical protein